MFKKKNNLLSGIAKVKQDRNMLKVVPMEVKQNNSVLTVAPVESKTLYRVSTYYERMGRDIEMICTN